MSPPPPLTHPGNLSPPPGNVDVWAESHSFTSLPYWALYRWISQVSGESSRDNVRFYYSLQSVLHAASPSAFKQWHKQLASSKHKAPHLFFRDADISTTHLGGERYFRDVRTPVWNGYESRANFYYYYIFFPITELNFDLECGHEPLSKHAFEPCSHWISAA